MTTVLEAPAESPSVALPLQTIDTSRMPRFSVARYHELIASGHFTPEDRLELLEEFLVKKMSKNTPHVSSLQKLIKLLNAMLPADWDSRAQEPITLARSEPEPDFAIFRPDANAYENRHPAPADIALLVEVSDSSLAQDRIDKLRIYARNGIVAYWIVNLIDRQIEVYEGPLGTDYQSRRAYLPGEAVPIVLAGRTVGHIAVDAMLPRA